MYLNQFFSERKKDIPKGRKIRYVHNNNTAIILYFESEEKQNTGF